MIDTIPCSALQCPYDAQLWGSVSTNEVDDQSHLSSILTIVNLMYTTCNKSHDTQDRAGNSNPMLPIVEVGNFNQ